MAGNFENPHHDTDEIYDPSTIQTQSLDMFAGDPDYQQCLLEVVYKLDKYSVIANFISRMQFIRMDNSILWGVQETFGKH